MYLNDNCSFFINFHHDLLQCIARSVRKSCENWKGPKRQKHRKLRLGATCRVCGAPDRSKRTRPKIFKVGPVLSVVQLESMAIVIVKCWTDIPWTRARPCSTWGLAVAPCTPAGWLASVLGGRAQGAGGTAGVRDGLLRLWKGWCESMAPRYMYTYLPRTYVRTHSRTYVPTYIHT